MKYATLLNKKLKPSANMGELVVDLFAGCGGLSLGFEAQGFQTLGFEMNSDACATYNLNLRGSCHEEVLKPASAVPKSRVLIGGPPCQPFSVGGHQLGQNDHRNGFPIFISAVKKNRPELWLFENVRGVFYKNRDYFDQVLKELAGLGYTVEIQLMNALDYHTPQNRERIFVVGHFGKFQFPAKSKRRFTAREALCDSVLSAPPESKFLTESMDRYIANYESKSCCVTPRDLKLDAPARTLTCRNLAGATGDMQRIVLPDGRRRRLLVREAATLQSFPEWWQFHGNETSQFTQIGNAVPPILACHIAGAVKKYLKIRDSEISSFDRCLIEDTLTV